MSDLGVPLAVPDLKEVKSFANHLHSLGKHWQGEIFGWQAEYTPESDKKPKDSRMTFIRQISGSAKAGSVFFLSCGSMEKTKSLLSSWMIEGS